MRASMAEPLTVEILDLTQEGQGVAAIVGG